MVLFIILFLAFFFYKESLLYYFISDDFISLSNKKNLLDLFRVDPLNNHYTPVNGIINLSLYKIFGANPLPFHLFAILVHLLNIYLVYRLAKIFINDKIKSILATLLFAFFFANYEVVYWFGATNNSLMVTFYLIALLSLIKYVKKKKILSCLLFQASFVIAFFTHEYAISLIPVGIIYWFLFTKAKNPKEFIKLFLLPIIVFLGTTVLKIFFVKMPLLVRVPSLLKFFAFSLRSFVYLFLPNPYLVDKIPNLFIPIIFLVILVFLFRLTKNKRTLFLLIWATTTIFVYSLTSAPQARYFYLSFIPVIIYILSVVNIGKAKIPPAKRDGIKLFLPKSNTIFYLLFILISGLVFLQNQKYYWQLNSEITKNVIKDMKKYQSTIKKTDVLYFVNLPDSSNDSIWKAYVFRAGFKELLNNFVNIYTKKIVYLTSFQSTLHTIEAPYVKPNKLKLLSKENSVVFVYQEELKSVVLFK